ncbi:MAG: radical SAM protein, partial [Anaerolineae bacterium]
MIREIQAKVLLSHVKQPDDWFGLKYNMNLYRGCQHRCIYCDSRSACYRVDNFDTEVLIKGNAIELLRRELASKRVKGTIGTGSMNDPYMPLEADVNLTGRALAVIAEFRFPVHVMTKSNLVLRDLETLCRINQVYAAVSF